MDKKLSTSNHAMHAVVPLTAAIKNQLRRHEKETEKLLAEIEQRLREIPDSTMDETKDVATKIRKIAHFFGVDPAWALAIAKIESNMGTHQRSPTGALGVFQMTSIAMKDLRLAMEAKDDDIIDIAIGILFLRLLKSRWGSEELATQHYCNPADRNFYVPKVRTLMETYRKGA